MSAASFFDSASLLQGGREVSDFISFIKRKATNKPPVIAGEEKKKKAKKDKKAKEEL